MCICAHMYTYVYSHIIVHTMAGNKTRKDSNTPTYIYAYTHMFIRMGVNCRWAMTRDKTAIRLHTFMHTHTYI